MVSKTRMQALVKAFDAPAVAAALAESPDLLAWRDERGRNWLHLACATPLAGAGRDADASVRTAEALLAAGLPLDGAAFTEGAWQATPVWFCIARGRNLILATWLLERGADPNYSLWAAAFNRDLAAIRLLVAHGANLEDGSVDESPFLGAVQWSHFDAAEELLRLGADPNVRDSKGMTALHYMLRKGSEAAHFQMLARHGARGDIPDAEGRTAADLLRRKRDPELKALAERLAGGG
ncbi:ankyrin repeat domain-containing protein [Caulobacter sp. KR2-114]|uniref:ankyrin repeat domain-containing protein n=1 Tax=Caulobacter sp. KR2-114 TaxID=3400912 RepID=UPI003C0C2D89